MKQLWTTLVLLVTSFAQVNNTAGGLIRLPANAPLGTNLVLNGNFAQGSADWTLPPGGCYAVDMSNPYLGNDTLHYTASSTCGSLVAYQNVTQTQLSYTLSALGFISTGNNFTTVKVSVHDATDAGAVVCEATLDLTQVGVWTQMILKHCDLLPVIHSGDTLSVEAVVQGTSGQAWFTNFVLQEELPQPIASFLLYPNYKGYLFPEEPQTIKLRVDVANPTGLQVLCVLKNSSGGTVKSIQQNALATQELDFDGSALTAGNYTLSTNLLNSGGKSIGSYPSYRIIKAAAGFRATLVNYIDSDNFLVHNGVKHFVWGSYDRWSSHRCTTCTFTNEAGYLSIPGFNSLSTVGSYGDTHLNAEMNINPFSGAVPLTTNDQITPWLAALGTVNTAHLQIVNNLCSKTGTVQCEYPQGQPIWSNGLANATMWADMIAPMHNNQNALGYYIYDEPKVWPDDLTPIFEQWPTFSAGDPGNINFGTIAHYAQAWRWRDQADVMSADPFPIGASVNLDEWPYGIRTTSALALTSLVTKAVVADVFSSRPVWMVFQDFKLNNTFPTYLQLKQQAYKGIINGATGLLSWGFVSELGLEYEWYVVGNQQPYFDYKQIAGEVTALDSVLISPATPADLSSVSNSNIEFLVKEDATHIWIFASNFLDTAQNSVTFTLATAPTGPVTVYSENRTVTLNGTQFTDTFLPNDVHVYEVTK